MQCAAQAVLHGDHARCLVITKETIKSLTTKSGIKTGLRPGGGECPSWPDASCCPPTSGPALYC